MTDEDIKISIADATQIVNRELKSNYTTQDMFAFAADRQLSILCYAPKLPLRIPTYQDSYDIDYGVTTLNKITVYGKSYPLLPIIFPYFSADEDTVINYPGKYFNPINTSSGKQHLLDMADCRDGDGIHKINAEPHLGLTASDYEKYSSDELDELDNLYGDFDVSLLQNEHHQEVLPFDIQPTLFDTVKNCDPEEFGYQLVNFKPNTIDFFIEQWRLEYFINEKKRFLGSIKISKQSKPKATEAWNPRDFGLPDIFSTLEPDANCWKGREVKHAARSKYIDWQRQVLSEANKNKSHDTVCREIAKSEHQCKKGTVICATYSRLAIEKAGAEPDKT